MCLEFMKIEELEQRKKVLIQYIYSSITIEDWHGVRDAASDIEVIEGKIDVLLRSANNSQATSKPN